MLYRIRNGLFGFIPYSLLLFFLTSCVNDMEKVDFFGRKALPSQTIANGVITRSSSGVLQMRLEAPYIVSDDKPQAKTLYPKGLTVSFYEGGNTLKATLKAGYAVSLDYKQLLEGKDSVVIVDYRTGDTSYLENLVWDQGQKRIYSNKPIRSVNGSRVTIGDAFESDENFEEPHIFHQRGTIVWNDD